MNASCSFKTIASIIETRRTTKVAQMNGSIIERNELEDILALANWAPTHGKTEPWRFLVYEGAALQEFCKAHAEMYKSDVAPDAFLQTKYDNLLLPAEKASHLVVAYMQRTPNTKIPVIEEIAASCAAIQNILLGAASKNIAAIWNTGGMFFNEKMQSYLNLNDEDILLGFLYLGYSDEPSKEGSRKTTFQEKIIWHS